MLSILAPPTVSETKSEVASQARQNKPSHVPSFSSYTLATEMHTQLDDLSTSLTQMIDSVNSLSSSSNKDTTEDDPMVQIAQILNNHLESLQFVDLTAAEVDGKVTEIEKRIRESGLGNSLGRSKSYGLRR